VKDGISLVKTGEGAMQEVQDMLNRMVTLATQSANGTYDEETDRANLQKEVDALKSEINRIADSSNFNGIKLLDGSLDGTQGATTKTMDLSSALTNVVARVDQTDATPGKFTVSLDGYSGVAAATITTGDSAGTLVVCGATIALKVASTISKGEVFTYSDFNITQSDVTINDITYSLTWNAGSLTVSTTVAPASVGELISDESVKINIATSFLTPGSGAKIDPAIQIVQKAQMQGDGTEASATLTLSKDMVVNGATIKIGEDQTFTIDTSTAYDPTAQSTTIGVKGLLDEKGNVTDDGLKKIAASIANAATASGKFIIGATGNKLTIQSASSSNNAGTNSKDLLDLSTVDKVKAQISVTTPVSAGKSLSLQIGDTSDSYNQLAVSIQDIHADKLGISTISISTQADAQDAINNIKTAINTVSSVRGTLGATQNRLEHTSNNLSVMTENIQDAESTIRDTDIAEEMMSYTKNSILVQSAQAMLAQANTVPQGVLQLLQ
jgi:flagellin